MERTLEFLSNFYKIDLFDLLASRFLCRHILFLRNILTTEETTFVIDKSQCIQALVKFTFVAAEYERAERPARRFDHRDLQSFREASAKRRSLKGLAMSDKNFNLYAKKSSKLR